MSAAVQRTPLTMDEKELITKLVEQGRGPTAISRRIGRRFGTVQRFIDRAGLRTPHEYALRSRSYVRGGRVVSRFTPDEDDYIQAMRKREISVKRIAELATLRFGRPRLEQSVRLRLYALAAREASTC